MDTLVEIYVFVFGLMVGSFVNVCIYRLPKDYSVVTPRSACTRCGSRIAWYDNVPVLSFLWLRGRCRSCGIPFGFIYPLIELLVGGTALYVYWKLGLSLLSAYAFVLAVSLIIVSVIDLQHRIIPNVISIPGTWIGLGMAMLAAWLGLDWPVTVKQSFLGILVGGGILWAVGSLYEKITGREGIGFGDVKLLALFGANVGVYGVMTALIYGSFFGSIIGIFMMIFFGKDRKYAIPFGPFLCLGLWVYVTFGHQAIAIPMRFLSELFSG